MDRRDFYFKQAVSELELNGSFDAVEQALWNFIVDMGLSGIASGMLGSQNSPTPNLAVTVSGPGYAFDQAGERIFVPASTPAVDVSQDSSLVPTTVSTGGNEKWVSVFVKFARSLSDPRVDGNSVTIQFQSNESYAFVVVQGAEAAIASAVRPTKDPTMLLLFDVHLIHGQTAVLNADISTTRRDDTFVFAQTPISLRAGNVQTAVSAMLQALNNHALGSAGVHADTVISSVSRSGSPFALSSGTVGDQLTALLSDINALIVDINAVAPTYASVAALRAATVAGSIAILSWANGGAGFYYYDAASTATDDGFSTIKPTAVSGAGRWRAETATRTVFEHYDDSNGALSATYTGAGLQILPSNSQIAFASVAAGDVIELDGSVLFGGATGQVNANWVISQTTPTTATPPVASTEQGFVPSGGSSVSLEPRGRYVVQVGDVGHTLTAAIVGSATGTVTAVATMIKGTQRRGVISAV